MRQHGLRGTRRGKQFDHHRARPAPRGHRTWSSGLPRRRARTGCGWSTSPMCRRGSGMAFTAFVTDVFSRRIVGGAPRTGCPPSCPWTPWRWRCGCAHRAGAGRHRGDPPFRCRVAIHRDPLRRAPRRRRRDRLDRDRRRQLRQRPGRVVVGLYKTECVERRRPVPHRRRPRTRDPVLGALVQREPPPLIDRIPHTRSRTKNEYYRENNPPSSNRYWENPPSTKPGAIELRLRSALI